MPDAPSSPRSGVRSPARFRAAAAPAALSALAVGAPEARACAVCFGAPGSDETRAMTWAILFMLGVLACVLSGVVFFMFQLARRARQPVPAHAALAEEMLSNPPLR